MEYAKENKLKAMAIRIRILTLQAIHSVGFGHIGGSLSIADVLAVLYGSEMRYNPQNPDMKNRDQLVCSKGHAGPAVYSALALSGFFSIDELVTLNKGGTRLPSHCDCRLTPGIDMTTGSLGQGASLACGLALGCKLKGQDNRVFLILGDGEINEGQVWEALQFASAKQLNNLVVLVDWNKRQHDGYCEEIYPNRDISAKLSAFGFCTQTVNGNDVSAIDIAFSQTRELSGKPKAIILDTIKGYGIPEIEAKKMNHSFPISDIDYEKWSSQLWNELRQLEG